MFLLGFSVRLLRFRAAVCLVRCSFGEECKVKHREWLKTWFKSAILPQNSEKCIYIMKGYIQIPTLLRHQMQSYQLLNSIEQCREAVISFDRTTLHVIHERMLVSSLRYRVLFPWTDMLKVQIYIRSNTFGKLMVKRLETPNQK